MNWLLVSDLDVLAELNTHHTDRQIQAVQGEQGNMLVGADLLTDCGPGQTWETYGEWLATLTPTEEQPAAQDAEPDVEPEVEPEPESEPEPEPEVEPESENAE